MGTTDLGWTEIDVERLRALAPYHPPALISDILKRGPTGIREKAKALGLQMVESIPAGAVGWTAFREGQLVTLWREGLSARQIVKILRNVTRNAVIGKVHRLGLATRENAARPKRSRPKAPAARAERAAAKPRVAPSPHLVLPATLEPLKREDGSTFSVLDVDDTTCRFPIGDPRLPGFAFCARPVQARHYCLAHNAAAFREGTATNKTAAARAYAPVHELARVMASGVHGSRQ